MIVKLLPSTAQQNCILFILISWKCKLAISLRLSRGGGGLFVIWVITLPNVLKLGWVGGWCFTNDRHACVSLFLTCTYWNNKLISISNAQIWSWNKSYSYSVQIHGVQFEWSLTLSLRNDDYNWSWIQAMKFVENETFSLLVVFQFNLCAFGVVAQKISSNQKIGYAN